MVAAGFWAVLAGGRTLADLAGFRNSHGQEELRRRVLFSRTGGPRYSLTFYLRIRLFTSTKMVQNNNFYSQKRTDFLSANSRIAVEIDGPYPQRITRETCTFKTSYLTKR